MAPHSPTPTAWLRTHEVMSWKFSKDTFYPKIDNSPGSLCLALHVLLLFCGALARKVVVPGTCHCHCTRLQKSTFHYLNLTVVVLLVKLQYSPPKLSSHHCLPTNVKSHMFSHNSVACLVPKFFSCSVLMSGVVGSCCTRCSSGPSLLRDQKTEGYERRKQCSS